MTQKDKDLLLKDLCARLPYGVKVQTTFINQKTKKRSDIGTDILSTTEISMLIDGLEEHKPYLFPLSSMTEEQKKEYNRWKHEIPIYHYEYGDIVEEIELFDSPESFEYLIQNHFDYRGLIPMGLAKDASGLNIY